MLTETDRESMRHFFTAFFYCAVLFAPLAVLADEKTLVAAGVPELGRPWHGGDYTLAAKAITSGTVPLPRFGDEQGRMFLKRLLATENLAMYSDDTLPLGGRMRLYLELSDAMVSIAEKYLAADKQPRAMKILSNAKPVHEEIAQVAAFMLRVTSTGIPLCNAFALTIPKDGDYTERMEGLREMQAGMTKTFSGAEASLAEQNFYSTQDLSALLEAMAETLPVIKSTFPAAYSVELRKKLEADKARFTQPKDGQNIQKMLDVLGR